KEIQSKDRESRVRRGSERLAGPQEPAHGGADRVVLRRLGQRVEKSRVERSALSAAAARDAAQRIETRRVGEAEGTHGAEHIVAGHGGRVGALTARQVRVEQRLRIALGAE